MPTPTPAAPRKIIPENDAPPDAAATHADTGNTGPDIFRGGRIHENTPSLGCNDWPSVARVNCIIQIDASENSEHIRLQERHQKLERGQQHDHDERQGRAE